MNTINHALLKEKMAEAIDLDSILNLIHSDTVVKNILKEEFNGKSKITQKDFNNMTDDEDIRSLLNAYMDENGIKIAEDKQKEEFDFRYSDDSIQAYYNEISQYKVFTPEEEKLVFTRIKYATNEKWRRMYKEVAIHHNLRYAFKLARNNNGFATSAHDSQDFINEANIGLMKAVDVFDVDLGWKFSTYATWWIRQAISRSVADKSTTIRIPVHKQEELNSYKRAKNKLSAAHGREMTKEEMAEILDVSLETINEWEKLLLQPVSLYAPIGEEEESSLSEIIPDQNMSTEDEAIENWVKEYVRDDVLGLLNERQQRVLKKRFGIYPYDGPMTLEEVAAEENPPVTRERIRQIEAKALRTLRTKLRRRQRLQEISMLSQDRGMVRRR